MEVDFNHPSNAGILRYLGQYKAPTVDASQSPDSIRNPYYNLGTHPDLVARLWDEITKNLPEKCNWVVYRCPVLVHPKTGIIFGFAGGTHTYGLRLPNREREEALRAGAPSRHTYSDKSTLEISEIGLEWVFGYWLTGEDRWCLAGYEYAGSITRD